MTKVDNFISKFLNENLLPRFENIENKFSSEATDIAQLEVDIDTIKSKSSNIYYF